MNKKITYILFLFLFILYMEVVIKIIFFKEWWNSSLFNIVLFSLPVGFFIYLIGNFFKPRVNRIIVAIILSAITFICISQTIYFKIYDSVFSFSATRNAQAVMTYFGFVLKILTENIVGILILLIPLILFFVFKNKLFDLNPLKYKLKIILVIVIIIIQFLAIKNLSENELYSDYDLYHNVHSPTLMTNKFGLLTTMRLDIQRSLLGFEANEQLFYIPPKTDVEDFQEEVIEYNTMNIDWDDLIQNETNDTLLMMHQYFSDKNPTNKNDWTGKFAGKNLVLIIAESFDHIAIDEEITPTLYKIASEGLNFTNFYTPIFLSTIDGEYITKTGLLPKSGVWSMYRTSYNYMPFVLGNHFRNIGYKTTAYHNGWATYYRRHLSHPNLGYDYYACGRELNINCRLWPQSDLEMIEVTASDYINIETPFMTYYLTISGHLRYNLFNTMAKRHWTTVKDLPYSEPVKCYMAQHVELDKAIEKLIDYLEEAGVAEDTVIAISSDHWPYGLTLDELNEKATINRDDFFERDRLPFIIWHKGIEGEEVKKLGSSIDVLPTISNLFGLEYDSRLLIGKDIFSNTEPIVIFANRSWITEKGKYDNIKKIFHPHNNQEVDSNYIERINMIVYNRFYMSQLILDHDYYQQVIK